MSVIKPRIGVLALQGAFALHKPHIEAALAEYMEVVTGADLLKIDALILPGGESSTMLKLIDAVGIERELTQFLHFKPSWGICAGAILMAKNVHNPAQKSFRAIDIEIERNAYGRQLDSIEEMIDGYSVSYIRAPKISAIGKQIKTLSTRDHTPTWVECNSQMITTFHPETNLNYPSPWHLRFVDLTRKSLLI